MLKWLLPREGEQGGEIRQTARLISQMRPDPQHREASSVLYSRVGGIALNISVGFYGTHLE